jgi:hypothetical protein
MHINQLKDSKYLKKEDCGQGILVTIKGLSEENMAMEGQPPEMKWVLHFMENVKPMALNSTNAQLIAKITNSEETDNWPGHKIVLYEDPNISFGGKLVGGIRVRAPRNQPPKPAPLPPTPIRGPEAEGGVEDSSIPF